jgi:outer membrane murein-binding lipoprotein Lpp
MRLRGILVVCVAGTLLFAGCRQPDGPLPAETKDDPNRLYDVSRDLLNVAGGDVNGPQELADDMKVWGSKSDEPWAPGDELAKRLATALRGKNLTEQTASQLARHIWIAIAGRELSARQVDRLEEDVKTLLVSAGASAESADGVAQQIDSVQQQVTTKQRWWFQVF